ncbi:MAG: molybdate ABC transporter substrate-binding protein, partial [Spirochaetaceae bacterium]|nr:molybdate ABC transporter substrate-binding protein [Spirochaetaceae bacterium]
MKKTILTMMICALLISAVGAQQTELLVSAASSLTDVLTSLKPEAEKATGAKILFNFGASGALRQQIESGAQVDVFFSAASEDVDRLEQAGLADKASRVNLLTNAIVLVGGDKQAKPTTPEELKTLLGSTSLLAIGNPDSVPAGRYAVQALKSLNLYSIVEKKLVLGGNVRQVLQYVESGSAPLGI